jgi:hypothetical protein
MPDVLRGAAREAADGAVGDRGTGRPGERKGEEPDGPDQPGTNRDARDDPE